MVQFSQLFHDSSIHFELSFVNTATDSADFEEIHPHRTNRMAFDDVRAESTARCCGSSFPKSNNGLTKTKFLTYGIEGDSMAQVKPRLEAHPERPDEQLSPGWAFWQKPLDGGRLRLMQNAEHGWSQQVPLQLERPCAQWSVRKGCHCPHCAGV